MILKTSNNYLSKYFIIIILISLANSSNMNKRLEFCFLINIYFFLIIYNLKNKLFDNNLNINLILI